MRPLLLLLLALTVLAPAARAMPVAVQAVLGQADDDPTRALQSANAGAAAASTAADRFWWNLAGVRLLSRLERTTEAIAAADQAEAALKAWSGAPAEATHWLQLGRLDAVSGAADSRDMLAKTTTLRNTAEGAGLPLLTCELHRLESWLLLNLESRDEAWAAAEAVERCGQQLQSPEAVAAAHLTFGALARRRLTDGETGARPEQHLERAIQALEGRPARFLRSLVAWEAGISLQLQKQYDAALVRLTEARQLSDSLRDGAGVAAAEIEMAAVLLEQGRPAKMLPLLKDARRRIAAGGEADAVYRMPRVLSLELKALTAMQRPEVLSVVVEARTWVEREPSDLERARLQQDMARALASLGRYAEAYALQEAAQVAEKRGRATARDVQLLRLQARYDDVRREAETAELRLRHEAARLELDAQAERNRALWVGIVALTLLTAVALAFGGRELARRRRMADLALRDELTGLPNRRAVQVYAAEQFAQAQRLDLPFAVALVDFDHFKQVNDRHGHAVGDAVLRAFATAAPAVLRGQDRIGRWGGEEWLLVMPGTRLAEVDGVFARLRRRFGDAPVAGLPPGLRCTFSMGAAERRAEQSLDDLIAAADRALYGAKAEGRDRLVHEPLPPSAAAATPAPAPAPAPDMAPV